MCVGGGGEGTLTICKWMILRCPIFLYKTCKCCREHEVLTFLELRFLSIELGISIDFWNHAFLHSS